MNCTKNYDLFGNEITKSLKNKKKSNETKKNKLSNSKKELLKEIDRNFDIAYCCENGDLFGNKPTKEERQKALDFLKKIEKEYAMQKNIK